MPRPEVPLSGRLRRVIEPRPRRESAVVAERDRAALSLAGGRCGEHGCIETPHPDPRRWCGGGALARAVRQTRTSEASPSRSRPLAGGGWGKVTTGEVTLAAVAEDGDDALAGAHALGDF